MKPPQTATEKLFYIYRDKVYGFFVDFLHNKEVSKDLTQDIFVKLIQKEKALQTVTDLDGYIFQMCRNLAFDYLKKAAHNEKYRSYLMTTHPSPDQVTNPTDRKINSDYYKYVLEQSLDKLPDQQRLIFNLSKKEGLSHKKIATKLGISSHTVRNHLYQAMKTLKSELTHPETEFFILLAILYSVI